MVLEHVPVGAVFFHSWYQDLQLSCLLTLSRKPTPVQMVCFDSRYRQGRIPVQPAISTGGWFQGMFFMSRIEIEMIYSRLKHPSIPQDHSGPHTENQNKPFIKPIQAAETGAWGLWLVRHEAAEEKTLFSFQMYNGFRTFWYFPWQQQRLLSPHIWSAWGINPQSS